MLTHKTELLKYVKTTRNYVRNGNKSIRKKTMLETTTRSVKNGNKSIRNKIKNCNKSIKMETFSCKGKSFTEDNALNTLEE